MYCYNCGSEIDRKFQFCPSCGTKNIITEKSSNPSSPVREKTFVTKTKEEMKDLRDTIESSGVPKKLEKGTELVGAFILKFLGWISLIVLLVITCNPLIFRNLNILHEYYLEMGISAMFFMMVLVFAILPLLLIFWGFGSPSYIDNEKFNFKANKEKKSDKNALAYTLISVFVFLMVISWMRSETNLDRDPWMHPHAEYYN